MLKSLTLLFFSLALASGFSCGSPKWTSSSYSTTDGFFHFDTTYITEFTLQCDSEIKGANFFAVVNDAVYRVAQSEETSKFQVSFQLPHSDSGAQDISIKVYDDELFEQRERAIRNGDAEVQPLFTMSHPHTGVAYPRTFYIEGISVLAAFGLLHYVHYIKTQIKDS